MNTDGYTSTTFIRKSVQHAIAGRFAEVKNMETFFSFHAMTIAVAETAVSNLTN